MSMTGVQGQALEITVVGCTKLKDTEWISRQDPYVCVEYGSTKYRTRTCTDGGKNPVFQEKFVFTLIEGLREINVLVWNSNTLTYDDFIGNGKIQLAKVISQGYDDSSWPIQTKTGRYAGEVRLIMHYSNANKPSKASAPSAPPYGSSIHESHMYSAPPLASAPYGSAPGSYPSQYPPSSYPPAASYPPSAYPPSASYPQSAYPPQAAAYPPPPSAYPPPPYSTYPPSAYPAPSYPPPPQSSSYYPPPGSYPGLYPPPPY